MDLTLLLKHFPLQTMNDQGQIECKITAWEPYKDDVNAGYNGDVLPASDTAQAPSSDPDDDIPF